MRNPNDVKFAVITTSTEYICKYGYSSGSGCFPLDLERMRELYGEDAVTTTREHGLNWIVVTQSTVAEQGDTRPNKTDKF